MSLNERAAEIHKTAVEHGWWEQDRNFGEMVALMHSELSEALEAHRDGALPFYIDYGHGGKPEGYGVEFIDCIIRILDTMHSAGLDIDAILQAKMDYNETRPYKHGGKLY